MPAEITDEPPYATESYQPTLIRLGFNLTDTQDLLLRRYEAFLATEAVAAGGIGPMEPGRLRDRHVLDSLMFLRGMSGSAHHVVDIGSGVGLPGIPIAIASPERHVTLVDRSQKRSDLASRAVRILDLPNVSIVMADAANLAIPWDVLVFRASFPVVRAAEFVAGSLGDKRSALLGVSRLEETPGLEDPPVGVRFELTEESKGVLDSPFWLLRMTSA
jgi:16S rRNA (guanine(527)-N(7))-methyltransferase RsmG